jgi:hypothetical protein
MYHGIVFSFGSQERLRTLWLQNMVLSAGALHHVVKVWSDVLQGEKVGQVDKGESKGNAIPLQAWAGPEGSRGFRLPDCKTVGT